MQRKTIKLTQEFYDWLLNKKKGKEKAIEDCLRRLTGYKKNRLKK